MVIGNEKTAMAFAAASGIMGAGNAWEIVEESSAWRAFGR
jgi:hypothetical protein